MKVSVIGTYNIDLILAATDRLPDWGTEVLVRNMIIRCAGSGGNTALALAKLEIETIAIGSVGEDEYGGYILNELNGSGIKTEGIEIIKGVKTGICVSVVNNDGERAFITYLGALDEFNENMVGGKYGIIEDTAYCMISGYFVMPEFTFRGHKNVMEKLKSSRIKIVFDTGWDPENWPEKSVSEIKVLLQYVDIFIPNIDEARALTGRTDIEDMCRTLYDCVPGLVIIKMGRDGAIGIDKDGIVREQGREVNVFDTTGAGDSFNAVVVYGLINNWNLKKILTFANLFASTVISREEDRFPDIESIHMEMQSVT